MQGGSYKITVKQHVEHDETADHNADVLTDDTIPGSNKDPTSTQLFTINAPRFSIPPDVIHQTYPPQGLGDHNTVLPHIVFDDAFLPLVQAGSPSKDSHDSEREKADPMNKKARARGKVPWMALLTFTEDEIKLNGSQMNSKSTPGGLFPSSKDTPVWQQDKSTFTVHMTMKDYLEIGGDIGIDPKTDTTITTTPSVITPVLDNDKNDRIDRTQQVNVVFVPRELCEKLIAPYDETGAIIPYAPIMA